MATPFRPSFERSALLVRHLTQASALSAWIQGQTVDVSWIAPAQREALIRLAHFSTRIEGNPLTLPEVEALAAGKELGGEERAKREVLNYFAALRWIWQRSPPREIEERELLHLHGLISRDLLPRGESGTYKIRPNAVYEGRRVIYKPPPPEAAPILTRALVSWLNSGKALAEHAVIAAAVAHHRLVSIHPFSDGNGRTARAFESWILFRRGIDTHHIFAVDEFFEADRRRYHDEIQNARDRGDDLTRWLEYVGEGVVETLRKTQRRIQALRARRPFARITLSQPQERILQVLGENPGMRGGDLARSLGMTRSHLSKRLKPLLRAGMVLKVGTTKASSYRLG